MSSLRASLVQPLLIAALLSLGAGTAGAADTRTVPLTGGNGAADVHLHDPAAATPRPADRTPAPNGVYISPWTRLGPDYSPGPTRRATLDPFGYDLLVGSQEAGYWTGFPFGDSYWSPSGDELDSGVHHMATGYYNPALGQRPQPTPNAGAPGLDGFGDRIVVSTDGGRVRWSQDDGYSWNVPIGLDSDLDGCKRLLRDGLYINVVYALMHHTDTFGYPYYKVYVSYDVGESWNESYYYDDFAGYGIDLFVRRDLASELFLVSGEYGDIFRSVDQAFSWDFSHGQVGSGPYSGWLLTGGEVASTLYALDLNGTIYRSTNWGVTFASHGVANRNGSGGFCGSVLYPGVLLEGCSWATDSSPGGWWSTDGGATWTQFDKTDWYFDTTRLCPDVLGIDCLLPSYTPTGATPSGGRPGPNGTFFEERFYIHTAGGTYIWIYDGVSAPSLGLMTLTNFTNGHYFDHLSRYRAQSPFDTEVGSRGRAQLSTYGSPIIQAYTHLSSFRDDVGTVTCSYQTRPDDPYVWSQFGGFLIVLLGSDEFAATADPPDPIAKPLYPFMMADPAHPFDLIWGGANLWRLRFNPTTDTFTPTVLAGGFSSDFYERVAGVGISPVDRNFWYLCTTYGRIFTSTDNGTTWTFRTAAGPQAGDVDWQQLPVTPSLTNRLHCTIAGDNGVVIQTTDGGVTWTPLSTGLPAGTRVWEMAYDNNVDQNLYAATEDGPMQFVAGSWTDMAPSYNLDQIPEVPFRSVESLPWRATMRWATFGRGLYDYATGSTSAVGEPRPDANPLLLAVRPMENPIRGGGAVEVTLPERGRVRLDLFDAQGRRVRALFDGVRDAGVGRIEVALDDSGRSRLSDGVYFLRLATDRQATATRIVLARE